MSNAKTVWFTFKDTRRDYSAADRFGEHKVIFSNPSPNFLPQNAIDHARRALSKMKEHDYIVPSGDPTLSIIVAQAAAEMYGYVNILRWDNRTFEYTPMLLDFDVYNKIENEEE